MKKNVHLNYKIPQKKVFGDYAFLFPKENMLETSFRMPLNIALGNITGNSKKIDLNNDIKRIYTSSNKVENLTPVIHGMCDLLTNLCRTMLKKLKGDDGLQLLYIANIGRQSEFISSIISQIDFEQLESYYLSGIQQIKNKSLGTKSRLCLLEPYIFDFRRIENLLYPGNAIIGGVLLKGTIESNDLEEIMKVNLLNKNELNDLVGIKDVNAFWMCETDFDSLTIWHKEIEGEELISYIESAL